MCAKTGRSKDKPQGASVRTEQYKLQATVGISKRERERGVCMGVVIIDLALTSGGRGFGLGSDAAKEVRSMHFYYFFWVVL